MTEQTVIQWNLTPDQARLMSAGLLWCTMMLHIENEPDAALSPVFRKLYDDLEAQEYTLMLNREDA